ncbi:MAG: hypothetical protein ACI808_001760 [Paraglaciecola sp.]
MSNENLGIVMKKILMVILATSAFAANAHMKSDDTYRFAGDREYSSFCEAVMINDLGMLKRSIRSKVGLVASNRKDVLRKLLSVDGMKCNGVGLIKFSKQREASEVYAYLSEEV